MYNSDVRLIYGENNVKKDVMEGSYIYYDVFSMIDYKLDIFIWLFD